MGRGGEERRRKETTDWRAEEGGEELEEQKGKTRGKCLISSEISLSVGFAAIFHVAKS